MRTEALRAAALPGTFVLLWSTGFLGARYGLPWADPLTLLALRLGLVALLMGAIAWIGGAPWPARGGEARRVATAGLLVHAVYLGGVFEAIALGLPAGTTAVIVGLQPLLTAVLAFFWLGERPGPRVLAGLVIGFAGVALVVHDRVAISGVPAGALACAVAALLGITVGTLYQKRHCGGMDLRSGTSLQYAASALVLALLALLLEPMRVVWTAEFVFALAWLCLVLSVGAVLLLFILIRRGAASRVASLFYLVPPVTTLLDHWLFGTPLGPATLAGTALAALGVLLSR
ncbi:MAG TPA: DMT family transporter [Azospirillaceae bacterium]|nr:DMT family transporter [Azospirillaceae bacterium]